MIASFILSSFFYFSQENLAYNKSTAQISDAYSGVSSRAVDGNSDTTFSSGSCSQTGLAINPWWRVDLGRVEPVNQVYIVNRGDCCGDLLNSFEIRVGRSQFRSILLNQNIFTNLLKFYLTFAKLLKIDFKANSERCSSWAV